MKKKYWGVVAIAILGVIGANFLYVCRATQAEYEVKIDELGQIRQNIFEAEYTNAQLRARVAHLKTDLGIEEVAREKLGYVYPDETSYVIMPAQPPRKPEVQTFPTNPQVNDEKTAFFSFVHAAFGPKPAEGKKTARS